MIGRGLLVFVLVAAACSDGETDATQSTAAATTTVAVNSTAPNGPEAYDVPGHEVWTPGPGTTWQWQLTGEIDTSFVVDMYDIDLFDVPATTIALLLSQGRVVICYFSAGSVEDWRPDAGDFPGDIVGEPLDGWPGERWLDVSRLEVLAPLMQARLDLAVTKGCDGVEPDNIEAFLNSSGFEITASDQLAFNRWLAEEAHSRGLSIGLKNDLVQAGELVDWFDWVLVEECVEFDECSGVEPFVSAGKAAFGTEYAVSFEEACLVAGEQGIVMLLKDLDLGPASLTCS